MPLPHDPAHWEEGPGIAESMSYPTLWRITPESLVMNYRVRRHLGCRVFCHSEDDGYTWSVPGLLTGFDHAPEDETGHRAGSCLAALPADNNSSHIAFVHWASRDRINPNCNKFAKELCSHYNIVKRTFFLRSSTIRVPPFANIPAFLVLGVKSFIQKQPLGERLP